MAPAGRAWLRTFVARSRFMHGACLYCGSQLPVPVERMVRVCRVAVGINLIVIAVALNLLCKTVVAVVRTAPAKASASRTSACRRGAVPCGGHAQHAHHTVHSGGEREGSQREPYPTSYRIRVRGQSGEPWPDDDAWHARFEARAISKLGPTADICPFTASRFRPGAQSRHPAEQAIHPHGIA